MTARRDAVGEVFGRLTVVGPVEGSSPFRWLCRCECGAECSVQSTNLYCGNTQSCGCLRREVTSERLRLQGEKNRHRPVLAYYKRNAASRDLEWALTEEEFLKLVTGDCHYCGSSPSPRLLTGVERSFNGIDRPDNTQGYWWGNAVSCCSWCNRAKSSCTLADFEAWMDRLAHHRLDK